MWSKFLCLCLGSLWIAVCAISYPWGCFTNVWRALQNNLSKFVNSWNRTSYFLWEIQTETLYMCPKHPLGTRTSFSLKFSPWMFMGHFWHCTFWRDYLMILESSRNVSETTPWHGNRASEVQLLCPIVTSQSHCDIQYWPRVLTPVTIGTRHSY